VARSTDSRGLSHRQEDATFVLWVVAEKVGKKKAGNPVVAKSEQPLSTRGCCREVTPHPPKNLNKKGGSQGFSVVRPWDEGKKREGGNRARLFLERGKQKEGRGSKQTKKVVKVAGKTVKKKAVVKEGGTETESVKKKHPSPHRNLTPTLSSKSTLSVTNSKGIAHVRTHNTK